MKIPRTIEAINALIANRIEESLHLDYKRGDVLAKGSGKDISKPVSSFANSDGGIVIIGIEEIGHIPTAIKPVANKECSRERLESLILSNISPRIEGVRIYPIRVDEQSSIYVVKVPRSTRGPHQASDNRYYKRFEFRSAPMEDYEIKDIRNRRFVAEPLISVDYEVLRRMIHIVIKNEGGVTAKDVKFTFPNDVLWNRKNSELPDILTRQVKIFPKGRVYRLFWNTAPNLFKASIEKPDVLKIEGSISYFNPVVGKRETEPFLLDVSFLRGNTSLQSDLEIFTETFKEVFRDVQRDLATMKRTIAQLAQIAGHDGLDLSTTSLAQLSTIHSDGDLPRPLAAESSYNLFKSLLGIDTELATALEDHFQSSTTVGLEEVPGITTEVMSRVREKFVLPKM